MNNTPDNNRKKQVRPEGGKFKPGESGNPSGRPAGSKSKVSQLVNDMIADRAEDITRTLIDNALAGDSGCLKMVIERLAPAPKDSPVYVTLPVVKNPEDIPKAMNTLLTIVAAGELTPLEGQALAGMLEQFRKSIETDQLARKLEALQAILQTRK